jgi:hypothetical protein
VSRGLSGKETDMSRAAIETVTLHRTKTTAWDQFHPIHCASLQEASRTIVRMANLAPPQGGVLADPVTVTVQWAYRSPYVFTYFLTPHNLNAADLAGALEGVLIWEEQLGNERAARILETCDLGHVSTELLAA